MPTSATATKTAATVEALGVPSSPQGTAATPQTRDAAKSNRHPAGVARRLKRPRTPRSRMVLTPSSSISNGIDPTQTARPKRGEGEIAVKKSHAQKNPKPKKRRGNRFPSLISLNTVCLPLRRPNPSAATQAIIGHDRACTCGAYGA